MECLLRVTRYLLLLICLPLTVLPLPLLPQVAPSPTPAASSAFEITSIPSSGTPGQTYELTIQSKNLSDCGKLSPKNLTLVAPVGSGVQVAPGPLKGGNCAVIADVIVKSDARVDSIAMLRLADKNGNTVAGPVAFNVIAAPPGAIPPGLTPQVDIHWTVVDPDVEEDNFGHRVRDKFYCIQMTIGNNSGYDLQISSVGFTENRSDTSQAVSNTDYTLVRGTLDWGQKTNGWSIAVLTLQAAGPVLTGLLPLVNNAAKRAQRTELINILSPVATAMAFIYPYKDSFNAQFKHLDDATMRPGFVVHNNTQATVLVFVAKTNVVPLLLNKEKHLENEWGETCYQKRTWRHAKENTLCIKEALGRVVLVGNAYTYLNRVRVVETSPTPAAAAVSLSTSRLDFTTSANKPQKFTLTNIGTAPLTISKISVKTATSFSSSSDCPTPPDILAVNASCAITITFTPSGAATSFQDTLSITDDASDSPQTVNLTGEVSPSHP